MQLSQEWTGSSIWRDIARTACSKVACWSRAEPHHKSLRATTLSRYSTTPATAPNLLHHYAFHRMPASACSSETQYPCSSGPQKLRTHRPCLSSYSHHQALEGLLTQLSPIPHEPKCQTSPRQPETVAGAVAERGGEGPRSGPELCIRAGGRASGPDSRVRIGYVGPRAGGAGRGARRGRGEALVGCEKGFVFSQQDEDVILFDEVRMGPVCVRRSVCALCEIFGMRYAGVVKSLVCGMY
jgi:hypothetical protein